MSFEEYLLKEIDDRIQHLLNRMEGGSAEDFSDYKLMVGRIRSLREVRVMITDWLARSETED